MDRYATENDKNHIQKILLSQGTIEKSQGSYGTSYTFTPKAYYAPAAALPHASAPQYPPRTPPAHTQPASQQLYPYPAPAAAPPMTPPAHVQPASSQAASLKQDAIGETYTKIAYINEEGVEPHYYTIEARESKEGRLIGPSVSLPINLEYHDLMDSILSDIEPAMRSFVVQPINRNVYPHSKAHYRLVVQPDMKCENPENYIETLRQKHPDWKINRDSMSGEYIIADERGFTFHLTFTSHNPLNIELHANFYNLSLEQQNFARKYEKLYGNNLFIFPIKTSQTSTQFDLVVEFDGVITDKNKEKIYASQGIHCTVTPAKDKPNFFILTPH